MTRSSKVPPPLERAATTYDAAQLPVIDKFLYHKDPVIRKVAMLKNLANPEREKRRTARAKGLSTMRKEPRANPSPMPPAPSPVPAPGQ